MQFSYEIFDNYLHSAKLTADEFQHAQTARVCVELNACSVCSV